MASRQIMSPTNPVTDLVVLHQRILADLQVQFPDPWKFAWYLRQPDQMPVPCIGLELVEFNPTAAEHGDIGTLQFHANLRFEAYVFTDYKNPDYRIKSRLYGAALAASLVGRQWTGVANGPCRVLGVMEDRWRDSGAAQYDCMRVEWEQTCLFNSDIYSGGFLPNELYLGFTPNIGSAHEADYIKVT